MTAPYDADYHQRHYRCIMPREKRDQFAVPADIEVRAYHEPCFMCGQREGCRHRD